MTEEGHREEIDFAKRYPLALRDFPFECNDGWTSILVKLLDVLESEIAAMPEAEQPKYRVVQIKEKFGMLRVYMSGIGSLRMQQAIRFAEEESAVTCELCGKPGKIVSPRHWLIARCPEHENA